MGENLPANLSKIGGSWLTVSWVIDMAGEASLSQLVYSNTLPLILGLVSFSMFMESENNNNMFTQTWLQYKRNIPESAQLKTFPAALPREKPPVVRDDPWGLTSPTGDTLASWEGKQDLGMKGEGEWACVDIMVLEPGAVPWEIDLQETLLCLLELLSEWSLVCFDPGLTL